jgi:hypothetical protein
VVSQVSSGPRETRSADRSLAARLLGAAALSGVTLTLAIFAVLHLLPPTSDISPVHRTISEYALTSSGWAFNLAVIMLALSSVAVLVGAVIIRLVPPVSVGTVFGALWVAGLLAIVNFPKHNWALGAISHTGQIHRLASLVAFIALPVAVMSITRRRGRPSQPRSARWAFWLAAASLLWFVPMLYAIATTPGAWWQVIPLGLIERGLALTEVAALLALAVLVRSSANRTHPADQWPTGQK